MTNNAIVNQPTSFNILGCCVSRGLFNVSEGMQFRVEGYIQRNYMFDIFEPLPLGDKFELIDADPYRDHDFEKRSLATLINGNA